MKIIRYKMCKYHMRDILFMNNCRKIFLKFGIYIILFAVAVLVALLPNVINSRNHVGRHQARYAMDLKYILFWRHTKKNRKTFFNKNEKYASGQSLFIQQNCPNINCFITYNKSLLQSEDNFDAIVFDIRDIKKLKTHHIMGRSPHQTFIFKSLEPSNYYPICNPLLDNFFNWTWTYKLDSDIPQPFLNIYNASNVLVGPVLKPKWIENMANTDKFKDRIKNKKKAVAWLINNCKVKHKHNEFVKDLRRELKGYNYSLDNFGQCSNNKCPNIDKCYKKIEEDYFFQLVLEDSVTDDYVTERVVKAMTHLSVPIVLGSNFTSFLPPGSYINAGSFDMKKLGAVIDYLIKNRRKYSYFFDWKKYYYYINRPRSYICDLCTKLNRNSAVKSYAKFRQWWNKDYEEVCENIHLYNKFKGSN